MDHFAHRQGPFSARVPPTWPAPPAPPATHVLSASPRAVAANIGKHHESDVKQPGNWVRCARLLRTNSSPLKDTATYSHVPTHRPPTPTHRYVTPARCAWSSTPSIRRGSTRAQVALSPQRLSTSPTASAQRARSRRRTMRIPDAPSRSIFSRWCRGMSSQGRCSPHALERLDAPQALRPWSSCLQPLRPWSCTCAHPTRTSERRT